MDQQIKLTIAVAICLILFLQCSSGSGEHAKKNEQSVERVNKVDSPVNEMPIAENSTDSTAAKKKTLQDIIDDAAPGDSVILGNHQFHGNFTLFNQKDISIGGNKLKTILINNSDAVSAIVIDHCHNISISGLTIKDNSDKSVHSTIYLVYSSNVHISNCDLSSANNIGVEIIGCDSVYVKNNFIHNCLEWGIHLVSKNVFVQNNVFSGNGNASDDFGYDISLDDESSSHVVMSDNTFSDLGDSNIDSIASLYATNVSNTLSFIKSRYYDAFFDYVITNPYKGKVAKMDFQKSTIPEKMHQLIRSKVVKGMNFGGHYVFIPMKNGKDSYSSVVVDLTTGRAVKGKFARTGYEYYKDSELLVVNPGISPDKFANCDTCQTKYFELADTSWIELHY